MFFRSNRKLQYNQNANLNLLLCVAMTIEIKPLSLCGLNPVIMWSEAPLVCSIVTVSPHYREYQIITAARARLGHFQSWQRTFAKFHLENAPSPRRNRLIHKCESIKTLFTTFSHRKLRHLFGYHKCQRSTTNATWSSRSLLRELWNFAMFRWQLWSAGGPAGHRSPHLVIILRPLSAAVLTNTEVRDYSMLSILTISDTVLDHNK